MNELFDIPPTKSPRLLWIKRHGIQIARDVYDEWEDEIRPFVAFVPHRGQAFADTEDEAIAAIALQLNLRLWIEE